MHIGVEPPQFNQQQPVLPDHDCPGADAPTLSMWGNLHLQSALAVGLAVEAGRLRLLRSRLRSRLASLVLAVSKLARRPRRPAWVRTRDETRVKLTIARSIRELAVSETRRVDFR